MNLKPGDAISIKASEKSQRLGKRGVELTQIAVVPDWLLVDKDNLTGSVVRIPTREEINPIVNEQLVVELYAR
jgi:small subunit ribosomal protein S4